MKLKAILAVIHLAIIWCLFTVAWPNAWAGEAANSGPAPWMQATNSMPDVLPPSNLSGADQERCIGVILGEINARLDTQYSFLREDVAPVKMAGWDRAETGFVRGGGFNIRIVKTLPVDDARTVHAGRFADWWTIIDAGIRPSLHIPGNFDYQDVFSQTPSADGQTVKLDFVAHTDDAYAYLPFGFILHEIEDVLGANTRPPCPIESDVDPEND